MHEKQGCLVAINKTKKMRERLGRKADPQYLCCHDLDILVELKLLSLVPRLKEWSGYTSQSRAQTPRLKEWSGYTSQNPGS